LRACIATTDVHEYGKILVETVLRELGVIITDGGTSTDPNDLAELAQSARADFIALSSYNGVALQFVTDLKAELRQRKIELPVFVGGKLNRVPMAATPAFRSKSTTSSPPPAPSCVQVSI
jgi:methylmalonyl-CoA mutase cobalamin-binding subunit